MRGVEIRELASEEDWRLAFPVMRQLRSHLDEDRYLEYLYQMTANGYRLFGLFSNGDLAVLAGVQIMVNMYYGRHLWVFELVTDAAHRSKGYGTELFEFLKDWAVAHGCEKIALSSGLHRADAHRFYEDAVDMDRASYVFTADLPES